MSNLTRRTILAAAPAAVAFTSARAAGQYGPGVTAGQSGEEVLDKPLKR
jgi:hypothetical protein